MKEFTFDISTYSKYLFFPEERVKSKIRIIRILLEASRYILSNSKVDKEKYAGEIRLVIDKMSRIFFVSDEKIFSIVFPFKLNEVEFETETEFEMEDRFELSYTNNINVNSVLISKAIATIDCDDFSNTCVIDFADHVDFFEDKNEDGNLWFFLKELMLFEDGYIRYDYDLKGYNEACKKGRPHKHPLHHYDLFYTNKATFKIGLDSEINTEKFIELLNVKEDCYFLRK
ncbi:MAG: hypothetical protein ACPG5B_07550 [Chitinophagales bacterium]